MPGLAPPRPLALCLAAAVSLTGLVGCSADRGVYPSTQLKPARVEVVDTLNNETVWAYDIPVEHKLVLDLDRRRGIGKEWDAFEAPAEPADHFKWWLYGIDARKFIVNGYFTSVAVDGGKVELPNSPTMVRYQLRPAESPLPTAPPPVVGDPPAVHGDAPGPAEEYEVEPAPEPVEEGADAYLDAAADAPASEPAEPTAVAAGDDDESIR